MIGLVMRVAAARVEIDGGCAAQIERGVLALIGIERRDDPQAGERLLRKILRYRIFPDRQGKMNLGLLDIDGGLLLVPQFTLAADTRKGNRPGFSAAAPPPQGQRLFQCLVDSARAAHGRTQAGVFGADMQLILTNDGPATFWLQA